MKKKYNNKTVIAYFTNCYAPPDQVSVGASARQHHHVKALADAGLNVQVVTASKSTISKEKLNIHSSNERITISTVSVSTIFNAHLSARIAYHVRFFMHSLWTSLRIKNPDLIVASIPTILIGWQGYIAARLKRAKLVLDVRDLWADSLSSTHFSRIPFFITLNRLLEKLLYLKSNSIICTTHTQAQEIQKMATHFRRDNFETDIIYRCPTLSDI